MLKKSIWSIKAKIIVLVTVAVACAQLIVCGMLMWQEARRYANAKRDTMVSAAQVLAAASGRSVAARDAHGVRESLRAIGRIPGLVYANVRSNNGRLLADMGATERLDRDLKLPANNEAIPLIPLLRSRSVAVSVPVVQGGRTVGSLQIVTDTRDLPERLLSAVALTLYGALIALLLALLLALRMQRSITRPIGELSRAMEQIGTQHDYNVTLKSTSRDEIGVLVGGFNQMMGDIRERDGRLARHREKLEDEVSARTEDFRQAKDLAEAANSAKSDFLATMSHEIRTPMNGILVMAELLAAGDLPARSRRYAEVIARSGQSLVAIINDILDFSKIEAGKLDVESLPVETVSSADTVVSLFAERAQSKGLDLVAQVDVDTPLHVLADPVRLNQVIGNLVNNALKFTEEGFVKLHVSASKSNPGWIDFSVIDTGIGIAQENLANVFGAFEQADQTTTRKFGGTGLGLSIARRLVSAMGGEIQVTSTLGEGSRFFFALPPAGEQSHSHWPRTANTEHAIVAVQGAATRGAMIHYLQAAGYRISTAEQLPLPDGAEASLVIADLKTLAAAKVRPAGEGTAVIVVTGLGDQGLDRLMADKRADSYFELPLSRPDVADALECLVRGDPLVSRRQSAAAGDGLPDYGEKRVLVADDSPVNLEVACEALRRFNISADIVTDGLEACQALTEKDYDLVLMDGSMPNLDGFEATVQIRARETETGAPRTPIIALTAHVVGSAANAWQDAGMDGVLHKPFTIKTMAESLRAVFGEAQNLAPQDPGIVEQPADDGNREDAILDPALIAQLREMAAAGKSDFVTRVTALYQAHAPKAVDQVLAGFDAGDLEAIGKAAHALKSMSFNAGAQKVAAAAAALENKARVEKTMPDSGEAARLDVLVKQACDALGKIAA